MTRVFLPPPKRPDTVALLAAIALNPIDPDGGLLYVSGDKLIKVKVNGKTVIVSNKHPCVLSVDRFGRM
jgi:hypothetical protein